MSSRPSGRSLRKQATGAKSRDPFSPTARSGMGPGSRFLRAAPAGRLAGMAPKESTATRSKGRPKIVPILIRDVVRTSEAGRRLTLNRGAPKLPLGGIGKTVIVSKRTAGKRKERKRHVKIFQWLAQAHG